jgi:rhamnose utilization protein RhaD (predicted bifunctional aldolase and dehydrogenase)
MNTLARTTAEQVKEYCARIGADPLLVQGAGGNVSWKDGDTLWIKASGTWLAESTTKDIFVPVDLAHLRQAIAKKDFSATPKVVGISQLRPSIETFLHALMPHRVVVHLHAIEVLAHLVHDNFQADFQSLLDESTPWAVVEYYKPGAALAAEINAVLIQKPTAKVIFLKNHGVVIGGADVEEVNQIITGLTLALCTRTAGICPPSHLMSVTAANLIDQYAPVADVEIHQLALNPDLFKRLSSDWALYPDHVVFLGPRAYAYRTWEALNDEEKLAQDLPELVFIYGEGVYVTPSFNKAKQVQLRCYFDVIARQKPHSPMRVLTDIQIAELLNWDAEQYRMNLAQ